MIDEVSRAVAKEAVEDPRVELFLGYKGIDHYTAMVVLNEVGDINRFSSARKLVRWVGLCPSVHQSGVSCRMGKMVKQVISGFVGLWFRLLIRLLGMVLSLGVYLSVLVLGEVFRRLLLLLLGSWLSLSSMF